MHNVFKQRNTRCQNVIFEKENEIKGTESFIAFPNHISRFFFMGYRCVISTTTKTAHVYVFRSLKLIISKWLIAVNVTITEVKKNDTTYLHTVAKQDNLLTDKKKKNR